MRLLDLFSGIGGFHLGIEQAGFELDWVGFSEVDKFASAVYKYRFPEAVELGDVRTIRHQDLPKIDIITFGSPCQDFSLAGLRSGMQGDRSSLISESIRLIDECRPSFFIWENVKGTFSSNNGEDFWAIIKAFTNLGGYRLEWQLLNTRWFPRTPQNRERIYLVGYSGDPGSRSVFPITRTGGKNREVVEPGKSTRQHSKCLTVAGNPENHSGMQLIKQVSNASPRERGFKDVCPSLLSRDYKDPKIVRVIDKEGKGKNNQTYAAALTGGAHSGGNHSDMDLLQIADVRQDEGLRIREDKISPCLNAVKNSETEPSWMPPLALEPQPVLTPGREEKRQNGRRFKDPGEDMFTLTAQDQHGVKFTYSDKALNETLEKEKLGPDELKALDTYNRTSKDHIPTLTDPKHNNIKLYDKTKIRRLTPIECMRLQGFPDLWNEYGNLDGKVVKISDSQRYKQAGNAVTVDVVKAVATNIKKLPCHKSS
tara:strand:- start:7230 stop:8675 length:1446 start_codon:yes stop_codon:yes gene_type:complete